MNMTNFISSFYFLDFLLFLLILFPSNLYKFHPLIFSLILFLYSVIISLKLNFLMSNFFFSFILFLIMVGGVMILIMYFTSISSNELILYTKEYLNYLIKKLILFMLIVMMILYLMMKNYNINLMINFDLNNFKEIYMDKLNFFILKNLYMNMNMDLTIFFMLYLFMMMMMSTLICMKFKVPMRQMMY